MGIPSYFAYIIKNHPDIIKGLDQLKAVDNLYLDSNSIIYDCLRQIGDQYEGNDSKFERLLLRSITDKLDEYIKEIDPQGVIFIAFDGVAPVAKLEQQRTRRYKSYLLTHIRASLEKSSDPSWDKTAITPGTKFMDKLGKFVTKHYKKKSRNISAKKIIVSTSNEAGEGEHKIFGYIRDNVTYHKSSTTLVYGLDADLIMLCLNHLRLCRKIFLYRETPEFVKSIDAALEPDRTYFLDIPALGDVITYDMSGSFKSSKRQKKSRLYDYIFLCFFLGNDFLPHFPSVNIRTNGIDIMIGAYRSTIASHGRVLTNGKKIYWNNVRHLVEYLADNELENLKNEYRIRARWERRHYPATTIKEQMDKLDHIPTKERSMEKFIDPFSPYWEKRYYKKLFDMDINKTFLKAICNNYMEGLEWVMNYYSVGCLDWHWKYRYNYPPLLNDLLNYLPHWDTTMIRANDNKSVLPLVQLSYVLPRPSLKLLPRGLEKVLLGELSDRYPLDCEIVWAFCKYLWEGHTNLPHITIEELVGIVTALSPTDNSKLCK